MAENENPKPTAGDRLVELARGQYAEPETKNASSGWLGAGIVLAICVTAILMTQMLTDYHW